MTTMENLMNVVMELSASVEQRIGEFSDKLDKIDLKFGIIGDQLASFEERFTILEEQAENQPATTQASTSTDTPRTAPKPPRPVTKPKPKAPPPPPEKPTRAALMDELKALFKRAE